jgi:glycosyltransferase involved in cell wall biosynthesis
MTSPARLEMRTKKKPRLAIVQYGWPLQSCTRDFVLGLAHYGYKVDFFLDKPSTDLNLINLATVNHPNLSLKLLPGWQQRRGLFQRWSRRVGNALGAIDPIIPRGDYRTVFEHLAASRDDYVALVGIEKIGFVFSGLIGQRLGLRYVYYSLELYFHEPDYRSILQLEKQCHRNAAATIVQDSLRATALLQNNGALDQPVVYLPVSVGPAEPPRETKYWHKRFDLTQDARIVLYFGMLSADRRLPQLISAWRQCPSEYILILHGYGYGYEHELAKYCRELNVRNVFISTELVPEAELPNLISSADLGYCVYDNDNINDRLTAFSSQKVALFMRAGVPIITAHNESYCRLFDSSPCGVAVPNLESLPDAIHLIMAKHEYYGNGALAAYAKHFSFETNFHNIVSHLNAMVEDA